ncbi:hypothetical protein Pmani_016719 [Petrolisthes manimaculis]|uniref:RETREG1-3/ARL6IP-like N-terminal reticulon-homology domain-containing protein n=1 Tax=Petrolisthes manimaculis TaxID=1843537 RepID=A0AAE1PP61_9EUCA|nr:hypothetical protein Pmani_016719 [Petrolisthes manimaculis]
MVTLQAILIWEKPGTSSLAVVAVNLLFWLVIWSELRVYFVGSLLGLLVFLHQQWVHSIWPEIRISKPEPDDAEEWTPVHPSVLSVPEISQYVEGTLRWLRDNYSWLIQLRRHQPALFSAIVTSLLSLGAVLGHMVPGTVLVYVMVMLVMVGPGIMLHLLPDSFYRRISKMRAALRGDTSAMETSNVSMDSDISDFLPELQSLETQAALEVPLTSQDSPVVEEVVQERRSGRGRRGGQHGGAGVRRRATRGRGSSSVTSGQQEESSLFSPTAFDDFPSYDNDSIEDLDTPDLELPQQQHRVKSTQQMEFVSTHFGDSSDEEDSFMEGLSFEARGQSVVDTSQHSQQQQQQYQQLQQVATIALSQQPVVSTDALGQIMSTMIAQNAGSVLSALGQNLVTSVIGQGTTTTVPPLPHIQQQQQQLEPSHLLPAPRMTQSQDSQLMSSIEVDEDFELISDEEFQ